jgi:hypothetical protein
MQVNVHRVADERAQEEVGRRDRERLTPAFQGKSEAFAISTGISAKTSTAAIASPSAPIVAVSSSPLRRRRMRLKSWCSSIKDLDPRRIIAELQKVSNSSHRLGSSKFL